MGVGLKRTPKYRYDTPVPLVLTSRRLFGMDGFELIKNLKATLPQMRIGLISAILWPEEQKMADSIGVEYYLSIPMVFSDLELILLDALGI